MRQSPPTIGSTWISVHGPRDAEPLARFALELGFGGIQPGPSPRALPDAALREHQKTMPFTLGPAWRIGALASIEARPDRDLASADRASREAAVGALVAAADQAASLGLQHVLLEPGRLNLVDDDGPVDIAEAESVADPARLSRFDGHFDRGLDAVCRSLHAACTARPDTWFCVGASRAVDGLGTPDGLTAILEDLGRHRVAYWHEAAVCAALHERRAWAQNEWFDRLGEKLVGITWSDWTDDRLHMPLGSGGADLPLLRDAAGRSGGERMHVVELDPEFGRDEARHVAQSFGVG